MKILYAASEAAPFAATGGLADVAGSLPRAIRNRQHACRVVLPLYSAIDSVAREKMKFLCSFNVQLGWRNQYCGVFEANHNGLIFYFLDNEYYFKREGGIYGFYDDGERFAFFSKALLEMLAHIDFAPDLLHCNDWQTAMAPVYLGVFYKHLEKYRNIKTIFTIHNIQYQGKYDMSFASDVCGLPPEAMSLVEFDGAMNMMKAAVEVSDRVSTVSPSYAQEITDPWYAHGLDSVLVRHTGKISGILNGIDTLTYNPETDPALFENYGLDTLHKKAVNKTQLQKSMGLAEDKQAMMIAIISRLVAHKGIDLVEYVFDELMQRPVQLTVLGSGDSAFERFLQDTQAKYPGRAAVRLGFIPNLARRIYAASDVLLMPSKSEPCGLAQMVALRYGTLPVVRRTGGLRDSIIDIGEAQGGNGFTFATYNAHDMLGAIDRALGLYADSAAWEQVRRRAAQSDFSWKQSAAAYVRLYKELVQQDKTEQ